LKNYRLIKPVIVLCLAVILCLSGTLVSFGGIVGATDMGTSLAASTNYISAFDAGTNNFMNKAGEDGLTQATAWTIDNLAELRNFRDRVNGTGFTANNFLNQFVTLTADIDMGGAANLWTPIGISATLTFSGNFDGGNNVISNMHIRTSGNNASLFRNVGSSAGSTVFFRNLTFTNIDLHMSGNLSFRAGPLFGGPLSNADRVTIDNVHVVGGTITSTDAGTGTSVGGLVGRIAHGSSITNCSVVGVNITAITVIGGVVGIVEATAANPTRIERCFFDGSIRGGSGIGGIVGSSPAATHVSQCYSMGTITVERIAGGINSTPYAGSTISNSFSRMNVTATGTTNRIEVGGIAGRPNAGVLPVTVIENTYATGAIRAHTTTVAGNTSMAGGIAGRSNIGNANFITIRNSVAANSSIIATGGETRAAGYIGPAIGTTGMGTLTNNLFNNQMPVPSATAGPHNPSHRNPAATFGRTFNQLRQLPTMTQAELDAVRATYTGIGWNFDTIWGLDPNRNDGYPILQAFAEYTVDYNVIGENGILTTPYGQDPSTGTFNVTSISGNARSAMFVATPDINFQVKAWRVNGIEVAGNKSNTLKVPVTADTTVTVEFEPAPFDFYVDFHTQDGMGTVSATADGNPVASGEGFYILPSLPLFVFTATPAVGWRVKPNTWLVNGTVAAVGIGGVGGTTLSLEIGTTSTVTVEFELTDYAVTFGTVGGNGIIAAEVNDIGITSGEFVQRGQNVVFTANPDPNFRVLVWRVNDTVVTGHTSNTFTLSNITATNNITVEFERIMHQVFFNVVGTNGTLGASGPSGSIGSGATVGQGLTIEFSASPASGFRVREWRVDGIVVGGNRTNLYFLQIAGSHVVTVEFEAIPPTVYPVLFYVTNGEGTLTAVVNGADAITSGSMVAEGSSIAFTATPAAGWVVREWRVNNMGLTGFRGLTHNITDLNGFIAITVEFEREPGPTAFPVTYNVSGGNGILFAQVDGSFIASGTVVDIGRAITFIATPQGGNRVREWTVNGIVVAGNTANNLVHHNLTAALHVTVEFEPIPPETRVILFNTVGGTAASTVIAMVDGNPIISGTGVVQGSNILFTATPGTGWQVREWQVNGVVTQTGNAAVFALNNIQVTTSVLVVFEELVPAIPSYNVTFGVYGGNGTMGATVMGIGIPSPSSVERYRVATFTAFPASGHKVREWRVNGVVQYANNISNTLTLPILGDTDVVVEFVAISVQHVVIFNPTGDGDLTARVGAYSFTSGSHIEQNSTVVFDATPAPNHHVLVWRVNGVAVEGNTSNALSHIVTGITIVTVEFVLDTHLVTFSVVGENGGTVSGAVGGLTVTSPAQVGHNRTIVVTATPDPFRQVREWRVNGVIVPGHTSTILITDITGPTAITVEFEPMPVAPPETRIVIFFEIGNGNIDAEVENVAITSGTQVELGKDIDFFAIPNVGYRILRWQINGATVANDVPNITLFDLQATALVTVEFERIPPITHAIIFTEIGVSESGILTATVDGVAITSPAAVIEDRIVIFTANPSTGFRVREWRINGVVVTENTTNNLEITADAPTAVTVEFEETPPDKIIIVFETIGNGNLEANIVGCECVVSGDSVMRGSYIQFNATPDENCHIREWRVNGVVITGNTSGTFILVNITEVTVVTVVFEPITALLVFNAGDNGIISATVDDATITSPTDIHVGSTIVFTATPDTDFQVTEWLVNGLQVAVNQLTFTFTMIGEPTHIRVEFSAMPTHAVTFDTENGNGVITATANGVPIVSGSSVVQDSTIVFTAIPFAGTRVRQWTINGTVVPDNTTNTLIYGNITGSITVIVYFEPIPANLPIVTFEVIEGEGTINAAIAGNGGSEIISGDSVEMGYTIIFTAYHDNNWRVLGWYVNGLLVPDNNSAFLIHANISGSVHIEVRFKVFVWHEDDDTLDEWRNIVREIARIIDNIYIIGKAGEDTLNAILVAEAFMERNGITENALYEAMLNDIIWDEVENLGGGLMLVELARAIYDTKFEFYMRLRAEMDNFMAGRQFTLEQIIFLHDKFALLLNGIDREQLGMTAEEVLAEFDNLDDFRARLDEFLGRFRAALDDIENEILDAITPKPWPDIDPTSALEFIYADNYHETYLLGSDLYDLVVVAVMDDGAMYILRPDQYYIYGFDPYTLGVQIVVISFEFGGVESTYEFETEVIAPLPSPPPDENAFLEFLKKWWWIFALALVALILFFLLWVWNKRRKRAKELRQQATLKQTQGLAVSADEAIALLNAAMASTIKEVTISRKIPNDTEQKAIAMKSFQDWGNAIEVAADAIKKEKDFNKKHKKLIQRHRQELERQKRTPIDASS